MRLVLDTDVVLAAMRIPTGASAELVRWALDGHVLILASVALVLEYEAVLTRQEHLAASGLTREEAPAFVDGVTSLSEPVVARFLWRPQLRAPSDEMVLEAAVNGRAVVLVTFNVRDYGAALHRFGIDVSRPSEVLGRLRNS